MIILPNDYDMNHKGLNDNLIQVTDIITPVRYENLGQQKQKVGSDKGKLGSKLQLEEK